MRLCSICSRSDVAEINRQLSSGTGYRSVAKRFEASESSVYRHSKHLMSTTTPATIPTTPSTKCIACGGAKKDVSPGHCETCIKLKPVLECWFADPDIKRDGIQDFALCLFTQQTIHKKIERRSLHRLMKHLGYEYVADTWYVPLEMSFSPSEDEDHFVDGDG